MPLAYPLVCSFTYLAYWKKNLRDPLPLGEDIVVFCWSCAGFGVTLRGCCTAKFNQIPVRPAESTFGHLTTRETFRTRFGLLSLRSWQLFDPLCDFCRC